ncbi:putative 3-hydroxyacyl-(acyl-carrier-protein) dehydratase FabZ [Paraburkholderia ribeironis]|uniref:Putative 3-hydroxyacyl-(Acyl-carrier-protein) dehydratase FabZ n=1 Tax=Paraburkholderia ribeironis TaxID=1247936 RepID=A0A1N7S7C5_9BURK|nr:3-hydroxyacyl-ACP dehydratase FabZ family protein [Paraburkholderia ribeironis]SIT43201.1 putative 3-hydroxyacyl-(acyl-carrier-protein) dehydratase FabZ [Paraburkholderia ribeironis]
MTDRIGGDTKRRYISLGSQTTMRFLPQSYPFILLDRVKACYPEEGVCHSVKHITMTDPVLSGHFPGFPIYPGVLIIEAMVQNAGMTATLRELYQTHGSLEGLLEQFRSAVGTTPAEGKQYVLAESRIKNVQPIFPGCAVDLEARLQMARDGMYVFKVCAQVDGADVARGQLTMAEVPVTMAPGMLDQIGSN